MGASCKISFLAKSFSIQAKINISNIYIKTGLPHEGDSFNSLPNDKILDWSKLKAFADDKINVANMMIFVFDRVKTLWEKEKMLVTSIFSFSLNVFKKLMIVNSLDYVVNS